MNWQYYANLLTSAKVEIIVNDIHVFMSISWNSSLERYILVSQIVQQKKRIIEIPNRQMSGIKLINMTYNRT